MSNILVKTTELAMTVTRPYVGLGDVVVDATCGNGNDTLTLAKAVGSGGTVWAFDIQKRAIDATSGYLACQGYDNVKLVHGSFATMGEYVAPGSASCVIFNLGYLPGGDKAITTDASETLRGLEAALTAIRTDGIVTVVMYDGHEQGREEKEQILEWAGALDPRQYHVVYGNMLNQQKNPPEVLWITRKR